MMLRAAVIALPLWWRRPAAEPCLMPHPGISPGFWSRRLRFGPLAAVPLPGTDDATWGRGGRPGLAGAVLAAVLMAGCSSGPDTLCQTARPAAALNDTPGTIARQAAAAKVWDSRCTVAGWVGRGTP